MAFTIVNTASDVTTANAGSASSITLAKPANTANGDVLVAAVLFRNSGGTVTTPSGWSQLGPLNTTNETFGLFYKAVPTASAETATSYTFSTSAGSSRAAGVLARIPGVVLGSIVDATGALAGYTGTSTASLPALTPVAAYTLLLAVGVANTNTTGNPSLASAPSGMTTLGQAVADNGSTATATLWLGAQILTTNANTGIKVMDFTPAAANSGGFLVTLTGTAPPVAQTTIVPDQTLSSAGWTANTGTILAAVSDGLDTTYAESGTLTGTDQVLRFGLPLLTSSPAGVRVKVRCALDVTTTTTSQVSLYQGATLLRTWGINPDSLGDLVLTASPADVAGVTDWSALEVEIRSRI